MTEAFKDDTLVYLSEDGTVRRVTSSWPDWDGSAGGWIYHLEATSAGPAVIAYHSELRAVKKRVRRIGSIS